MSEDYIKNAPKPHRCAHYYDDILDSILTKGQRGQIFSQIKTFIHCFKVPASPDDVYFPPRRIKYRGALIPDPRIKPEIVEETVEITEATEEVGKIPEIETLDKDKPDIAIHNEIKIKSEKKVEIDDKKIVSSSEIDKKVDTETKLDKNN